MTKNRGVGNVIMKKAPKFLKKYFWDINFDKLDVDAHPQYVLGRILEYGDEEAIKWMRGRFSRQEIIATLKQTRQLSIKSANFWTWFFKIDKAKIRCLNKSFQETRKQFWPY